ncbi:hypothetical protein D9613_011573 [Agrocybe pediades]|uniref:Uncharacterized protein n=1 Tax=Agrocybe pediades TaxID=84607 RepID=A0A8H4QVE5_9AGAR|nr:hypothetical protein D9613_011573 [Agrocybe pediades]
MPAWSWAIYHSFELLGDTLIEKVYRRDYSIGLAPPLQENSVLAKIPAKSSNSTFLRSCHAFATCNGNSHLSSIIPRPSTVSISLATPFTSLHPLPISPSHHDDAVHCCAQSDRDCLDYPTDLIESIH